jgi:hypothetical protein
VTTTKEEAKFALSLLVQPHTILVGHSLESDLKALGLSHDRVIDTAVLYPHPNGLPYKMSLRQLTQTHLKRAIQIDTAEEGGGSGNGESGSGSGVSAGHDSTEDAAATLELALLRMSRRNDPTLLHEPWSNSVHGEGRHTLFHALLHERRKLNMSPDAATRGNVNITFCLSDDMDSVPWWERFSLGYRQESDVQAVSDLFARDACCPADLKQQIQVTNSDMHAERLHAYL